MYIYTAYIFGLFSEMTVRRMRFKGRFRYKRVFINMRVSGPRDQ